MDKKSGQKRVFSTGFKRGLIGLLFFGLNGCSVLNVNRKSPMLSTSYSEKVINSLLHIYNGKIFDMPVCLVGSEEGDFYRVSDIEIPFIHSVGVDQAGYVRCDEGIGEVKGYIGMIHRHLDNNCMPSEIDVKRFSMEEQAKIEAIICGMDFPNSLKIRTYIKENFLESLLDHYRKLASREESGN